GTNCHNLGTRLSSRQQSADITNTIHDVCQTWFERPPEQVRARACVEERANVPHCPSSLPNLYLSAFFLRPGALPLPQSPLRVRDMVQGKTKGMQSKGPARAANKDPKKGKRVIPPKKAAAVKHSSLQKSLSAKINNSIERQMAVAASSGKLTIMKSIAESSTSSNTKSSKSSK
ncbi:hypothetical protein RSAG8_00415, partial [Rhizoctonia solani AG-8 WAC10335]